MKRLRTLLGGVNCPPAAEQANVLLRLERSRLEALRNAHKLWSFDAAPALTEVAQRTNALEQMTRLAKRLCTALVTVDGKNSLRHPPSLVDRLQQASREAFRLLERMPLSDEDAATAEQLIRTAEELAGWDGQPLDWLETQIKAIEQAVHDQVCSGGQLVRNLPPQWEQLAKTYPGIFDDADKWATTPLFPGQYVMRDRRAFLLSLVQRVAALDTISPANSSPERQAAMAAFLQGCTQDADLENLRRLAGELEQDCYEDQIVAALQRGAGEIVPQGAVSCFEPVNFQIVFPNAPRFTGAVARKHIGVVWEFGHGELTGTGWSTWHYFPRRGGPSFSVSATFLYPGDQPLNQGNQKVQIRATIDAESLPPEFRHRGKWLETVRFSIVLLTATFGIQAARQLLPTADVLSAVIGILALGFTATTMRSLLSSPS